MSNFNILLVTLKLVVYGQVFTKQIIAAHPQILNVASRNYHLATNILGDHFKKSDSPTEPRTWTAGGKPFRLTMTQETVNLPYAIPKQKDAGFQHLLDSLAQVLTGHADGIDNLNKSCQFEANRIGFRLTQLPENSPIKQYPVKPDEAYIPGHITKLETFIDRICPKLIGSVVISNYMNNTHMYIHTDDYKLEPVTEEIITDAGAFTPNGHIVIKKLHLHFQNDKMIGR